MLLSIQEGYIDGNTFTRNREVIEVVNTFIAIILLVLAAIFSYYRFFRGRTFSLQADISLTVTLHSTAQSNILHVIDVEFVNNGAFPIIEPTAKLLAYRHGINQVSEGILIDLIGGHHRVWST